MRIPKTTDYQIRRALTTHLLDRGYERNQIRHEITFDGHSSDGRGDMIIIRPDIGLIGVEIKSGCDTLDRLVEQRPRYAIRFDRCLLVHDSMLNVKANRDWSVAGWEHVEAELMPGRGVVFADTTGSYWYGLGAFDRGEKDFHHRLPRLSPYAMLLMLWANELTVIAGAKLNRQEAIRAIADAKPIGEIRIAVMAALMKRRLNDWEVAFWNKFDKAAAAA